MEAGVTALGKLEDRHCVHLLLSAGSTWGVRSLTICFLTDREHGTDLWDGLITSKLKDNVKDPSKASLRAPDDSLHHAASSLRANLLSSLQRTEVL